MSALLLHGLQCAKAPPRLHAPPHLRLPSGDLVALCTPADPAALRAADDGQDESALIDGALAHDRLLRACLPAGPLLPVRFGTAFSGAPALRRALHEDAPSYRRALCRIGCAWEFALRATLTAEAARAAGPTDGAGERAPDGRTFLKVRRQRRDARQRRREDRLSWAERLAARVLALAEDSAPARTEPDRLLSLSLLVERRRVAALEACIAEATAEATRLGLVLSLVGPLPAYSFVEMPRSSAREMAYA